MAYSESSDGHEVGVGLRIRQCVCVCADYALKGRLAESRCSLLTAVKVDTVTVMHREVRTDLAIPDSWIAIIDPTPNGKVSVSRCLRCPTRSKLDRNHDMCNSRTARESRA